MERGDKSSKFVLSLFAIALVLSIVLLSISLTGEKSVLLQPISGPTTFEAEIHQLESNIANATFQAEGSVKFNQNFGWFRYYTSNDPFGPGTPIPDSQEIVLTPGTNYYIWVRQASINGTTKGTILHRASNASAGGIDGHVALSNIIVNSQPFTWEWLRYTNLNGNPYFTKRDGTGVLDDNSKFDWAVVVKTDNGIGEVYVDKILVTTDANFVPSYITPDVPGISTCNNYPGECGLDDYGISYCSGQRPVIDSRNERLFVSFDSNFNDALGNNANPQNIGNVQTNTFATIGNSGYFNGNSYLVFNDSDYLDLYGIPGFSISFWMQTDPGANGTILSKKDLINELNGGYSLKKTGSILEVNLSSQGGSYSSQTTIKDDGDWHHYSIVFPANVSIFEDGVLISSNQAPLNIVFGSFNNSYPFYIGHNQISGLNFTGRLDELEIGRYLFANEAQTRYKQRFDNYIFSETTEWICDSFGTSRLCSSPVPPLITSVDCLPQGNICGNGNCVDVPSANYAVFTREAEHGENVRPTLTRIVSIQGETAISFNSSSSFGGFFRYQTWPNTALNDSQKILINERHPYHVWARILKTENTNKGVVIYNGAHSAQLSDSVIPTQINQWEWIKFNRQNNATNKVFWKGSLGDDFSDKFDWGIGFEVELGNPNNTLYVDKIIVTNNPSYDPNPLPTPPGDSGSGSGGGSGGSGGSGGGRPVIVGGRSNTSASNLCGNGICDVSENINTCPQDCTSVIQVRNSYCGNGICDLDENQKTCSQDCGKKDSTFIWVLVIISVLVFAGVIVWAGRVMYINHKKNKIGNTKSFNELKGYSE